MPEKEESVNLLSMLNDIDVDKVGNVLKEFEKYEKILDKVSGITMRLNRIGVLPAVLRIAGQKSGVQNLDAPLPQQSPLNIEAASSIHLLMYKTLNQQSEAVISELYENAVLASAKLKKEKKPKNDLRKT
jgi:hypothetical protein